MTTTQRDRWEAEAIGAIGGSAGTALSLLAGAPLWLPVVVYFLLALAVIVYVNRKARP